MGLDVSDTRQVLVTLHKRCHAIKAIPNASSPVLFLVRHCYISNMLVRMLVSDAGYSCCCTACKCALLTLLQFQCWASVCAAVLPSATDTPTAWASLQTLHPSDPLYAMSSVAQLGIRRHLLIV